MRTSIVCISVVALLGGSGCGADTAGPVDPSPELRTSMGIGQAPPSSGPFVVRFDNIFGLFLTDPEAGLTVTYGFDPVALCQGGATFDVVHVLRVNIPEGDTRLKNLVRGQDLRAAVWPFAVEGFPCALYTTVDPVGTGIADLVTTDNDLLAGSDPNRQNSNSFGFTGHGVLDLTAGGSSRFHAATHCVWDGKDVTSLSCTDHIGLARP